MKTGQNMDSSKQDERFESRWAIITTLLSMDVVVPFYELMGIYLADSRALVTLLRKLIIDIRRETSDAPLNGPYYSARRIIDNIKFTLGIEAQNRLLWWEKNIFDDYPKNHVDLRNWRSVLRECQLDKNLWNNLKIPKRVRRKALLELLKSFDQEHYERTFEKTYSKPLSDWDLHMYAVNLYNDDDEEGIPNGPDTWVHPTCRVYQDFCFWSWMIEQLQPEELGILQQNANKIVEINDSIYASKKLIHPIEFEIGL